MRILFAIALLSVNTSCLAQEKHVAETPARPMSYSRIISDEDGNSHFETQELAFLLVEFSPELPPVSAAQPEAASRLIVLSAPAGAETDWHPVPRRQLNIMLAGEVEIEVSDGETRRFGPGSYILGEDTVGRGHVTRVLGETDAYFAVITLGES